MLVKRGPKLAPDFCLRPVLRRSMIVGAGSLRGGAAELVLQHGRELAGEPPAPGELVFSNMDINLSTTMTTIFNLVRMRERSLLFSDG